jgi:hypothetical protein
VIPVIFTFVDDVVQWLLHHLKRRHHAAAAPAKTADAK